MATISRENIGLLNDKIVVKVDQSDYLSSFEKSLKQYSKRANIPGFRKGMVPAGMIKKIHGQAVFADEVLRTVEKELNDYMIKEKLDIFAQPLPLEENDPRQINMNNPREYEFAFEVGLKPVFEIPNLGELRVRKYNVEITDDMVTREVERLRKRHGQLIDNEAVSDPQDILSLSVKPAHVNDFEQLPDKELSVLVEYFSESMQKDLQGKKVDETFDFSLPTAIEKEQEWVRKKLDMSEEEFSSGNSFTATIKKISRQQPADLTEEFFKTAYPNADISNEDDLKEEVRNDFSRHYEEQAKNQFEHDIYHALLDNTKIDFPETFLKRWLHQTDQKKKTIEEIDHDYPVFVNQLKWTLITDKLVKEYQIEVSHEDVEAIAKKQLLGYMGMSNVDDQPWIADYVTRMMQDRKFLEDITHRAESEKLFAELASRVTKEDVSISADEFHAIVKSHQHHH